MLLARGHADDRPALATALVPDLVQRMPGEGEAVSGVVIALVKAYGEKLAKEVLPGAVVFSSTRLLGGPGDRPHVVAPMSWSPGHEVAAHVVGAGTFAAV